MRWMQLFAVIGMAAVWWGLVNILALWRAHIQQRRWQAEIDDWAKDIR